jgi:hypothetical protein
VLSVFLRATCKDKSPILNRFKYTVCFWCPPQPCPVFFSLLLR